MELELMIQGENEVYFPEILDEITWQLSFAGYPGKLNFTCLDDENLKLEEGSAISLRGDGQDIFYGFLFEVGRSKNRKIPCMAYDQLRYLKNKETYVYENKDIAEVIQMIANDFNLQTGELAQSGYKIKSRIEDNQTLFDIIQNAISITLSATGELYILFDAYGKLTLKKIGDMKSDVLISDETAQDYDEKTSIDHDTYNQIKLYKEDKETGKRSFYIAKSGENINKWGVLQKSESLKDGEDGQMKADALLELYNSPTKTLKVRGAFGSLDVRPGVLIPVLLEDLDISKYMLVDSVTHKFKQGVHTMDLDLRGGDYG